MASRYKMVSRCLHRTSQPTSTYALKQSTPVLWWLGRPHSVINPSIRSTLKQPSWMPFIRRLPKCRPSASSRIHPSLPSSIILTSLSLLFLSPASSSSVDAQDAEPPTQELRLLAKAEEETQHKRMVDGLSLWGTLSYARYYIYTYFLEPVATGLRFLHLALLFLPVMITMPAIWIGPRLPLQDGERAGTLWWYSYLVKSMEMAGPTFIKLGQWAASRTDIFPMQMCFIMSTLHSNVAAHSLAKTKEIIEEAFSGRSFDTIFLEFDETPLGVGAIAQVYRAKLRRDLSPSPQSSRSTTPLSLRHSAQELLNKLDTFVKSTPSKAPSDWVAIKVLHPYVEQLVHRDLRIMKIFANIINSLPTLEWLSLPDEVDKFGEMMRLQLDLRIEANNLLRFRDNFKNRNTVTFPMPYMNFSTRQVLVEEFALGIPLEAFLKNGGGVFQKQAADMGLDAFLHMLLIDNFAHADLHPGNILIRFYRPTPSPVFSQVSLPFSTTTSHHHLDSTGERQAQERKRNESPFQVTEEVLSRLQPLNDNPAKWRDELSKLNDEGFKLQLIFIDTGLVTELSPINRRNFLDLFTAVAEFDGYRAGELMVSRCRQPSSVRDKDIFCLRMQHLVLGVKNKTFTLGKIKIADILSEVMSMIRSHHVRLEGDFINVVVSILLLEGIGRRLDPNIDIFKSSLPILRQIGAQQGHQILNSDISLLRIWLGLELRTIVSSSCEDVDNSTLIKYFWNE
ncbi:hypothetical protein EYR41_007144 [Orbilia oligospora]|uniref:ABC1 atypical kinase-like domain-containing protein n=1 Tax=Orbilia oligospora TaxID=2813651 RepID=A0A7C8PI43_ORBOL|nr:hypothetical protein TWF751_008703 [Orbilia oligospora]KAF3166606.1 hypothetical protein TWF751_008703 [Orbilia oligospora]KAF3276663.1 hypothetical protein TWF132_002133 [Orbilia oligospora]KAF3276664.1 hypothetical protein TWF132_002133 [Orbilia oligospora]TGJ68068.1 hypothetical protein EYR41_007144 [Orbilia oligospora]